MWKYECKRHLLYLLISAAAGAVLFGTTIDDSFIKEPMRGSYGPFEVPEGHYFMLGDNRNNSHDSRKWENKYVPKEDILGKAGFRYWPLNKIGFVK